MSSEPHLEFFFDRGLGRRTAEELRRRGWVVHLTGDTYPDDAQFVEDEAWIEAGVTRGWVLLTKDQKIRYRINELAALGEHGRMFCLSNSQLTTADMVARFDAARTAIHHQATTHDRGFWKIYEGGRLRRTWP